MKTAISIPDPVFQAAEKAAQRLRVSRSQLYTKAVQEFLEHRAPDDVTEQLNRVYSENASSLDPGLAKLQALTLADESW